MCGYAGMTSSPEAILTVEARPAMNHRSTEQRRMNPAWRPATKPDSTSRDSEERSDEESPSLVQGRDPSLALRVTGCVRRAPTPYFPL